MNAPIQPPAPINPVITIQPVAAAITNDGAGAPPNPLLKLPTGTLVEGFVINRDAQNNPVLRTSIGDLQVKSEVFLKTGSEVVFRVDAKIESLARILTVDGLTPEDYSAQNNIKAMTRDTITATPLQAPTAAATTTAGVQSPLPRAGATILEAILLQVQPQAATLQSPTSQAFAQNPLFAQLAQLRAGTPIRLTLLDLKLPPLPVALTAIPVTNKLDALLPAAPSSALPSNAPNTASPLPSSIGISSPPTPPSIGISSPPTQTAATSASPSLAPSTPATSAPLNTQQVASPNAFSTPTVAGSSLNSALLANEVQTTEQMLVAKPLMAATALAAKVKDNLAEATLSVSPYQQLPTRDQQVTEGTTPFAMPALSPKPVVVPTSAAPIVTAQVIGHDAEGANILHTPVASFKLYTSQPLPTGTQLVVNIEPQAPANAPAAAPAGMGVLPSKALSGEESSTSFKALEEAFAWLSINHPALAREVQTRLPTLGNKLTSGILFFIAAVKGGSIEEVFGRRAARQLDQSMPELLARARQEMTQAQAAYAEAPTQQWTTLTLPMVIGHEVHPMRLYVQRDGGKVSTHQSSIEGQRFVLEVALSELGPMQFDGFVRKSDRRRSFDLVVRSATPLEEPLIQTIRGIFVSSMEAVRMHGQVIFQAGSQHFIKPVTQSPPSPSGDGMQTILA